MPRRVAESGILDAGATISELILLNLELSLISTYADSLPMDEPITKRIHISGLTPAITQQDLSNRLSSFGTVKSIDGFGLVDAVGQPRKFAYATLETTKGKLARCTFNYPVFSQCIPTPCKV